jgi:hypothetical protein
MPGIVGRLPLAGKTATAPPGGGAAMQVRAWRLVISK